MEPIENTISFLISNTSDSEIKKLNYYFNEELIPNGKNVKALAKWLSLIYDSNLLERAMLGRLQNKHLDVLYLTLLINYTRLDIKNKAESEDFSLNAYYINVGKQLSKHRLTINAHFKKAFDHYELVRSFRKKFDFFMTIIENTHG